MANIVLNELYNWIERNWEEKSQSRNGSKSGLGHISDKQLKTKLKAPVSESRDHDLE